MSTNSSERTVTTGAPPPATTPNTLSTAHHFVSIKLTSRNFLFWRTQLVPFLRGQGLLGYVDGETPCPLPMIDPPPSDDSGATTAVPQANPAYRLWTQQDQSILSLLISSLSEEVMYLAVGRNTSREVWQSITVALGSSKRARCMNLLGQFQSLRQGNSSPAEFLGRAQLLVEDLALAGRPVSLDEQNLFIFRGLRPEFRAMAASLTVSGNPITIPQLSDFLQAQEFILADDYPAPASGVSHSGLYTARGGRGNGEGNSRGGRGRGGRGGNGRGGRNGRGNPPRC
ncbi:PREDICTED: uncharacterized protein LOC109168300 [Ipomoea nil]|uniref:uncharacterized protein LOC109168300 n=1 Tax=Ipomoea nil TaxID=35883 RepID=UPI000900E159|nr:PREDICTED: uncharacterized protein LOC109168300 [Ipomoea nil]